MKPLYDIIDFADFHVDELFCQLLVASTCARCTPRNSSWPAMPTQTRPLSRRFAIFIPFSMRRERAAIFCCLDHVNGHRPAAFINSQLSLPFLLLFFLADLRHFRVCRVRQMREMRMDGIESTYRSQPIEENMRLWKEMQTGSQEGPL